MENKSLIQLPTILDKEISSINDDKFGHIHYARALFSTIENHKPPFSIGILGEWGVGKSSIKRLCIQEFLNKNKDKYEYLDFNAWRYESEDVRRSLLKFLYNKLSNENEEHLKQKLYSNITDIFKREKSGRECCVEFIDKYLWVPIQIVGIFLVLIALAIWISNVYNFESYNATIIYTMFAVCGTAIIKYAFNVNGFIISKYTDRVVMTPPIISSEQFEDEILNLLTGKSKNLKIPKNKKIIIFIDDLDRLAADKMISGLDAIRVFLDIPESNFIFVVSCYDEHIAKSITKTKTTFSNIDSARKYLDRVFQFKIDIPSLPNQSMKNFVEQHLKGLPSYNDFEKDVHESNNYNLNKLLNILVPIEVNNPRAAIQILNSYMQAWWLAKQREEQCESCNKDIKTECLTNAECLLIKNIISSRLDILAVITVLKTQFPVFYNDLIAEPQLLKCIMWKLFNLKTCEIVENSQLENLTQKYLVKNEDEEYIMSKKCSNLQSYLASIQNVTIPDDIKPFMMLLQDNLEREIGANTVPIYNALITQDYLRLREVLGINNNTDKLSNIQTSQIYRVLQQINSREDDDRMMKAYILLTKISNLYNGNNAKLLTNDIVKTLFEKNFIEQVSIYDIEIILNSEYLLENNVNKIFSYLIKSLTEERMIESLNKEQSENYFKKVLSIGLKLYYSENKLDKLNIEDLRALLDSGQYLYEDDNSATLLYGNIDIDFYLDNIQLYGESLLKDLGLNYISKLLSFIERNPNEDIKSYISQIDFILSKWKEEKVLTKEYADIIEQGIANSNSEIVIYFENIIITNKIFDKLNIDFIPTIINNYAKRICINFSGTTSLRDIKTRISKFISIIKLYQGIAKNKVNSAIEPNINSVLICLIGEYTNLFDELFSIHKDLFKEQSDSLFNKLLKRFFITDDSDEDLLDTDILILLSEKHISTSQIELLTDIFAELFEDSSSEIDSENSERYYHLISHLNHDNYQNEKFRKHISNMYEALESAITDDYDDFIDGIFDTISPFFNIIKTTELDSLLSCITEYFTVDTEKTEKLYKLMNGRWPSEDSTNLPNYSIENIAKNTLEIIKKTDCSIDKKAIFQSVYSIYKDKKCSLPNFKEHITHSLMYLWKEHTEYAYNELLNFKDIMLQHFCYEWLGSRTPKEYDNLLESYWKEIFKIANNEELKKRTKHYITEYKNNSNKDLWFDLLYQRLGNIDIISEISTELISSLNVNFIEQCKFISNYIQSNYDNKIKNIYAKALFHGYISIQDADYKKEILVIMKKLLDKEAKGFFSKSDFKNSLNIKNDVDKMYKAFKKNKALLLYRKELFSRKKKVQK